MLRTSILEMVLILMLVQPASRLQATELIGRVVDADTGQAVPARVYVRAESGGMAVRSVG